MVVVVVVGVVVVVVVLVVVVIVTVVVAAGGAPSLDSHEGRNQAAAPDFSAFDPSRPKSKNPQVVRHRVLAKAHSLCLRLRVDLAGRTGSESGRGGEGNVGALIIRIEFWGPLYYTYNKEPPK